MQCTYECLSEVAKLMALLSLPFCACTEKFESKRKCSYSLSAKMFDNTEILL